MTLILEEASTVVHLVKETTVHRGIRTVTTKCGYPLAPDDYKHQPYEWTAWDSRVTCPNCKWKDPVDSIQAG